MFPVLGQLEQRSSSSPEQDVEKDSAVLEDDCVEFVGHGENHMEVVSGKYPGMPLREPPGALQALTLRAVPCADVNSANAHFGSFHRKCGRYRPPPGSVSVALQPLREHYVHIWCASAGWIEVRQPIQWACCATNQMRAYVRIFCGRCDGTVSKEGLNDPEICSKLQHMSSKRMA